MTTEYRVVISKIERDIPTKDKEYQQVGKDEEGEPKYEYVYFDTTKDVSKEVFNQLVPDIDIVEVITAVNKVNREQRA